MSNAEDLKSGEYTVKVSTEALMQAADRLKCLLEQLDVSLDIATGKVRNTTDYWSGRAADELRRSGEECAELAETARKSLLLRVDELKTISGNYYRAESESEKEARELPSSILS